MDQFIAAILPQSPGLAVAVVLVFAGLKYLENAEKRNSVERTTFLDQLKEMGDSCHSVQRETSKTVTDCVNKNTEILGQVKHALDRIKQ